jgi:hypothetical protein
MCIRTETFRARARRWALQICVPGFLLCVAWDAYQHGSIGVLMVLRGAVEAVVYGFIGLVVEHALMGAAAGHFGGSE